LTASWLVLTAQLLAADPPPPTVYIDRKNQTLYLIDAARAAPPRPLAPIGIGRGGLDEKATMGDLITPTGTFTVELILTTDGDHNAISPRARAARAASPDAALLTDLPQLFDNMNTLDFDGDGSPDRAYGSAYIGLASDTAVTGPGLRRYKETPYWYAIALHGTPDPSTLGAARSGGCVHLTAELLARLLDEEILTLGSPVTIADGPPG
jgi:hypothetical protein